MVSSDQPLTLFQALQLAMEHFQAGRLAQAEALLHRVLAAQPDNVAALDLLGCITQQAGRPDQALALFRHALGHAPDDPFLHFNLGVVLESRGDADAALGCFQKVVAFKPDHTRAHGKCGDLLQQRGEAAAAVDHFRRALSLAPGDAELHSKLGNALHVLGRWEEAAHAYHRALQLRPDYAAAHNNLGVALQQVGRSEEALARYRQALALNPAYADAHNNLGIVLQERGQPREAIHHYRAALRSQPDNPRTQWNLATSLLLCGDYAEGLECYERRFSGADDIPLARRALARLAAMPRWQGGDLGGRTLLVWGEQGLGDCLMMLRYLPRLQEERGAGRIVVACLPALTRLVRGMAAVNEVIGHDDPIPMDVDCHCPIMSLPYLFGTRLETIPATVPYLSVPAALSAPRRQRLASYPGLKVGLAWAGRRTQSYDARRSIAFERLAPLLAVAGVQWVSLQTGEGAGDPRVLDWMAGCRDFLDTAALVEALDLVISVDTAVAHLAGALAKPAWLLNRYESEWRWLLAREDSPWYPSMRIFRQPVLGDWDSVIAQAAAALFCRVNPAQ